MPALSLAPGSIAVAAPDTHRASTTSRERAVLFSLVAIYAEVVVVLALTGRFTFVYKTAIVPALVITAMIVRRLSTFLADWAVFLGAVILFDALRGAVYFITVHFHLPIHATYVVRADQAMLGGQVLSVSLQRALFQSGTIGPLEQFLTVVHGSHFLFFLLVGMAVWLFARDQFWRFRRAMLLLMGLGILIYFAVPTVPPWMASQMHVIPPIRHITAEIYNTRLPTLQATFDTNPVAAMPSLHTAFPTLCSLIALHHFGRRALWMPVYTLIVYFTIAYLGEHYLLDILAGMSLATLVYWIVYRWSGMKAPATDVAPVGPATAAAPEGPPRTRWVRQAVLALILIAVSEVIGEASRVFSSR